MIARNGRNDGTVYCRPSTKNVVTVMAASETMPKVAAILLAIYAPANAFLMLYGTAVAGMLFIWIVILFTYLRFRASISPEQVAQLPIRLPAHKLAATFGIVSLVAITLTTFFVDGLQYTVPSFLPFLAVISILYARMRKRAGAAA